MLVRDWTRVLSGNDYKRRSFARNLRKNQHTPETERMSSSYQEVAKKAAWPSARVNEFPRCNEDSSVYLDFSGSAAFAYGDVLQEEARTSRIACPRYKARSPPLNNCFFSVPYRAGSIFIDSMCKHFGILHPLHDGQRFTSERVHCVLSQYQRLVPILQ